MKRFARLTSVLAVLLLLFGAGNTLASSSIVDVSASVYSAEANDVLTGYFIGGYDVMGTTTYAWANNSLQIINNTTETSINLGTPTGYSGWNSFVTADGDGGAYVGFTVSGNTDDRIYHVDSSGSWDHVATMAGNFDMEIYDGNAYVSGLNSTNWSDPNSIWLLDESGANDHDLIVEMSGNSAGIAFDNSGNAYYASYDKMLYTWDAADIAGAIGTGYLTYGDGTQLATLEAGAYDITVDDAGHVIFNGNTSYNYIAMWNGTEGAGSNYDYIGIGPSSHWYTFIDAEGDVTQYGGGSLYQGDYYNFGLAEVNAVPVPAAILLMGSGLLGLVGIRRRRVE